MNAIRFIKSLVKATVKLEAFPMAGRSVPEFEGTSANLREVIYLGYRIIYRLTPDQNAEIITVAHRSAGECHCFACRSFSEGMASQSPELSSAIKTLA